MAECLTSTFCGFLFDIRHSSAAALLLGIANDLAYGPDIKNATIGVSGLLHNPCHNAAASGTYPLEG
jgi:hypothetical protein